MQTEETDETSAGQARGAGWFARLAATFRSLRRFNYRLWAAGALVSNVGTWMQRIAQDWLVLNELTRQSGTAVGFVMSLQFGPPILLMPLAGFLADRYDKRRLLMATQSAMMLCALGLGLLVLSGHVQLWQVYAFAGIVGCVSAIDSPVRQTFVAELVGERDLPNAVALNSSIFNSAQLIGPALAGALIAFSGTGWVFIVNAASFVAVIAALAGMRLDELAPPTPAGSAQPRPSIADGLRYIRRHPDLMMALAMLFLVATYGLNFPIFVSTMVVREFHGEAHLYGALSSTMAVGSVLGALLSASRQPPGLRRLARSALAFGVLGTLAALMPVPVPFGGMLLLLGIAAQVFTTSANSFVQLGTEPALRGRVMAIYMGIFLGCTPLGAPLVGWVADTLGPRWALGVGAASGMLAATVAWAFARRRLRREDTAGR